MQNQILALGVPPTGTGEMAAVNVRCLDDVESGGPSAEDVRRKEPLAMPASRTSKPAAAKRKTGATRSALVLQGGGALGAYELGVLQRLHKEPDFVLRYVSGVSIGAITAAVLVGARNGDPLGTLETMWKEFVVPASPMMPGFAPAASMFGNPAFYRMRHHYPDHADLDELLRACPIHEACQLVDFDLIMKTQVKVVVTATNVRPAPSRRSPTPIQKRP